MGVHFLSRALTGLVVLVLTVALVGYGVWHLTTAMREEPPSRTPAAERSYVVNAGRLEPVTFTPEIVVNGRVRGWRIAELRAAGTGEIRSQSELMRNGAFVPGGTLLARIDPEPSRIKLADAEAAAAEVEARAREASQALEATKIEVEAALAMRELRQRAVDRQQALVGSGTVSTANRDSAEMELIAARQTLAARQLSLVRAENEVERIQLQRKRAELTRQQAARDLAETDIIAPFSGILADVDVATGRRASANERLAMLIDPNALEVEVTLSARDFAKVLDTTGAVMPLPATIRLATDGWDLETTGTLLRAAGRGGAEGSGRTVFVGLDGQGAMQFRPGDFVAVTIQEPPLDEVAVLPAAAIDRAGRLLTITEDNRLVENYASVVRRQGNEVVLRDVPFGEAFVRQRTPRVGPGILVEPSFTNEPADGSENEEQISLDDARRQRLLAFVDADNEMPAERKARIRSALAEERVSRALVDRLEARPASGG